MGFTTSNTPFFFVFSMVFYLLSTQFTNLKTTHDRCKIETVKESHLRASRSVYWEVKTYWICYRFGPQLFPLFLCSKPWYWASCQSNFQKDNQSRISKLTYHSINASVESPHDWLIKRRHGERCPHFLWNHCPLLGMFVINFWTGAMSDTRV